MRMIARLLGLLVLLILGLMVYIRLAPSEAAEWHVAPPDALFQGVAPGQVAPLPNGALLVLGPAKGPAAELLAKLDAIALATPRTARLAGSVEEGRITWITRSKIMGFPDYTTAEIRPDGLFVYARQRFGSRDMGVNAARLTDWLSSL
jgi:hypothetical protein